MIVAKRKKNDCISIGCIQTNRRNRRPIFRARSHTTHVEAKEGVAPSFTHSALLVGVCGWSLHFIARRSLDPRIAGDEADPSFAIAAMIATRAAVQGRRRAQTHLNKDGKSQPMTYRIVAA